MDEKQGQAHRQHFNLSEGAKQMLEELTARRYPGKQRRQSQVVEDLIGEAFRREKGEGEDVDMGRFASVMVEVMEVARREAVQMGAVGIYPEHILLGVIGQGESEAAELLRLYGLDGKVVRAKAKEVLLEHYGRREGEGKVEYAASSRECLERAVTLAEAAQVGQVLPEHVILRVLHHEEMQALWEAVSPSLSSSWQTLRTRLLEEVAVGGKQKMQEVYGGERIQRRKVAEAKRKWEVGGGQVCRGCGQTVEANWTYCVYCGKAVGGQCGKCGAPRIDAEGVQYCFQCGSRLGPSS